MIATTVNQFHPPFPPQDAVLLYLEYCPVYIEIRRKTDLGTTISEYNTSCFPAFVTVKFISDVDSSVTTWQGVFEEYSNLHTAIIRDFVLNGIQHNTTRYNS